MSRGDLRDLGEALDAGQGAIIVIGESKLEEALEKELEKAENESEQEG